MFYFENKKIALLLKLLSESLLCFCILTKAKMLPSFSYHLFRLYVELRLGVERHVCLACIAESKTRSEQKRVIQSHQDVQVFGLFLVIRG